MIGTQNLPDLLRLGRPDQHRPQWRFRVGTTPYGGGTGTTRKTGVRDETRLERGHRGIPVYGDMRPAPRDLLQVALDDWRPFAWRHLHQLARDGTSAPEGGLAIRGPDVAHPVCIARRAWKRGTNAPANQPCPGGNVARDPSDGPGPRGSPSAGAPSPGQTHLPEAGEAACRAVPRPPGYMARSRWSDKRIPMSSSYGALYRRA